MRNNKRKGFTLVELLVVIAILAILATVSVVGYTSFIRRAEESNDENLVAQLNNFLTAYMADHTSTYYGQEITDENGRGIVLEVLELSGLDDISPITAKYGNHIYLNTEEDKFVLVSDDVARVNGASRFIAYLRAFAEGETAMPKTFNHATCFTNDGYVFADTAGSNLADAVRAFETSKNVPEDSVFNEAYLESLLGVDQYLDTLAQMTVFVTKNGNFNTDAAVIYNMAYHDDEELPVQELPTITIVTDDNGVVQNPITVPDNVVLGDEAIRVEYENSEHAEQASSSSINILMSPEELADKLAETALELYTQFILVGNQIGVLDNGTGENEGYLVIKVDTREYRLTYKNAMDSFNVVTDHVQGKLVTSTESNAANVLWGYTESIQLRVSNVTGEKAHLPASSKKVTWHMEENDYVTLTEDGILTLTNNTIAPVKGENEFTVTATSKVARDDGTFASQTFTITIVTLDDVAGITLDGNAVDLDNETTPIDLYYGQQGTGENKDTFTFDFSNIELVIGAEYVVEETPEITVSVDSADAVFTVEGNALKLKEGVQEGTAKVTIKVGNYLQRTITVSVYDASKLYFESANSNIKYIGNGNEIKVSDLIKLKDGATWPANATVSLTIYQAPTAQMPFGSYQKVAPTIEAPDGVLAVSANTITITPETMNQTVKFSGSGAVHFVVTLAGADGNAIRASADYVVDVKNGYNVKQYSDLKTNASNMLLSDIELPGGRITFDNAGTIYGNCFTFNIEKGDTSGWFGIITLNNTNMRDLRVIGSLYETVGIAAPDPYGTNAVYAKGTVLIDNCYIANCRAPLSVGNEDEAASLHNVTVKDSVIFGGRYCNIEVRSGTLKFEGKVYSINQPHTNASNADVDVNTKIAGLGVTVWLEAPQGTDIQGVGSLIQYTFIPQTYTNIPTITITASDMTVSVEGQKLFNTIFTEQQRDLICTEDHGCGNSHEDICYTDYYLKYADYHFTDSNGTKYINTSVVGEDLGALASIVSKPSGDRTGLTDDTATQGLYSYQNISVETSVIYNVTMHTYIVLNTRTDLFEGSQNAEIIFSPWTQTSGTETYGAYGFVNGSILPQ